MQQFFANGERGAKTTQGPSPLLARWYNRALAYVVRDDELRFGESVFISCSSLLLVSLFGALGFVFHYSKLNLTLHVVNAVNDDANFVADGVGFL